MYQHDDEAERDDTGVFTRSALSFTSKIGAQGSYAHCGVVFEIDLDAVHRRGVLRYDDGHAQWLEHIDGVSSVAECVDAAMARIEARRACGKSA